MLDVKVVRKRQTNYPAVFKAINRNFLPKAGIEVQGEARNNINRKGARDLGLLHDSVKFKVKGDKVFVGSRLEYAIYVEYGTGIHAEGGGGRKTPWTYFSEKYGFVTTSGMVARPYLRPALDSKRKFLVKLWAETYNKVFRVLGGKA